jgi:hypothetical protein
VDFDEGAFNIVREDGWSLCSIHCGGGLYLYADGICNRGDGAEKGVDSRIVWLATHLRWMSGTAQHCSMGESFGDYYLQQLSKHDCSEIGRYDLG